MTRPKRPTDNRWTRRAHGYRDPAQAALDGGRWVRRGLIWTWTGRRRRALTEATDDDEETG